MPQRVPNSPLHCTRFPIIVTVAVLLTPLPSPPSLCVSRRTYYSLMSILVSRAHGPVACDQQGFAATDDDEMEQQDPPTIPHPLLVGYRSDSRLTLSVRYRPRRRRRSVMHSRCEHRATSTEFANRLTHSGQTVPAAPRSAPPAPAAAAAAPHTSYRTATTAPKEPHTLARARAHVYNFGALLLSSLTPSRSQPSAIFGCHRSKSSDISPYPVHRRTLPLTSFRERLGARAHAAGCHERVSPFRAVLS